MGVAESRSSVRVAELLLRYFDGVASIHDETGDGVTERMEPAARDAKRVEDRPELIFHNFVGRGRPAVSRDEKESFCIRFPVRLVLGQDRGQGRGQRDRRRAPFALCGLRFAVPRGAADMDAQMIEVYISPL